MYTFLCIAFYTEFSPAVDEVVLVIALSLISIEQVYYNVAEVIQEVRYRIMNNPTIGKD